MKLYEILPVFEARAKPELNPQISAVDQLRQYKDDPNIFISFTNINKIGIYPLASDGETPIGIYAFPLRKCWSAYNVDEHRDFREFPSIIKGKHHIQILKWNGKQKFISPLSSYGYAELEDDLNKLKRMYDDSISDQINSHKKMHEDAFAVLYHTTYELVDYDYVKWNHLLRKLGYSGFNDSEGLGLIHDEEPYQTVFLSMDSITRIDSIYNKQYRPNKSLMYSDPKNMHIEEMMDDVWSAKTRIQKFEPYILATHDPLVIQQYMQAASPFIWPQAEQIIKNDPDVSYWYAINVLRRRFHLGEPSFKTNADYWEHYVKHFGIKE